ncbi:MAG TPA: hypothetical protein VI757_06940 [Bacteroidia bacterium]|nr:hypothetical protein [Bacteroidia bacterium]
MNKNLLKIIVLCFLAPTFFLNFWLGKTLFIDKLLGFTPERIYYNGVSCGQPKWTYAITFFSSTAIYFAIILAAFYLIKNSAQRGQINRVLLGSFLFYPVASRWAFRIFNWSYLNPGRILEHKEALQQNLLPFYGNYFNMQMTTYIVSNLFAIFYLFLAWQVAFRYWDKTMRIQFFTFGLVSCVAGQYFWYSFLGPLLYR